MPTFHPNPPRVPPHLHSEQEVLLALRTLPPEAHVFVRLSILDAATNREREIDFLVIHPVLGLVIVEVKGKVVQPEGDHWVRKLEGGRTERMDETPGEQLNSQQYALLHFLQSQNIGHVPQITRVLAVPTLNLREDQSLGPDLPACRILTRSKLAQPFVSLRSAVSGGSPWDAWRQSQNAWAHRIRPDTLERLLEALRPTTLPPPPLSEILAAEGRVQDERCQFLLDHLASNFSRGGRFHITGGPGSGKSLLARNVARIWASEGRRVLVIAFNRALTYATQCALADLQERGLALVSTYHDLALNLLHDAGRAPIMEDTQQFFMERLPQALKDHLSGPAAGERAPWDAVIVDEAQDLEPEWIRPLFSLLRHPDQDPVLLLEDPAQSLYRAAQHQVGQPWRLDLSLRQHPAIRRATCLAFPSCGWEPTSDGTEDVVRFVKSDPKTWRRDLETVLGDLAKESILPHQVMILSPHRAGTLGLKDDQPVGLWPLNTVPDWWEDEKATSVRFGTVHAFKGLESDVVVYLAPAYRHKDRDRLAYTAYSRARHRLIVLEGALAEPSRPKAVEAPVEAALVTPPKKPPVPQIKQFSADQQGRLQEALTAAKRWKPSISEGVTNRIPLPGRN